MKLLLTGSRGFIGTWLTPELRRAGFDVVGVDRADGDLADRGVAEGLISLHSPDAVVHLAARTSRFISERDPYQTVRDNALASMLVARACGYAGTRLVYISTSEVYGHQGDKVFDEESPTRPTGIYGLSKLWGEQASQLYAPGRLLVLRLTMPYGPGHVPGGYKSLGKGRAALPNFLWLALHRRPIPVHIGGARSWCWVGDVVRAMHMLIEQDRIGVWNVGRDDDIRPMRQIAEIACDMTDAPYSLIRMVRATPEQVLVKRLSTKKLMNIGWRPSVSLEDGMHMTLEWVKTLDPPEE